MMGNIRGFPALIGSGNPEAHDYAVGLPEMCAHCGCARLSSCDGKGWLEPIGPCADGSYITSRPCIQSDPYYETH